MVREIPAWRPPAAAIRYEPLKAAILGVVLHGLAGDIAARNESEEYIIAGDICRCLGQAFQELHAYKNSEIQ